MTTSQDLSQAATGKQYDNECRAIFRVRDGQITEVREYLDSLHGAQVLFRSPA